MPGSLLPISPYRGAFTRRRLQGARRPKHGELAPSSSLPTGVPFLDQIPAFAAIYPNARIIIEIAWGANPFGDQSAWSWTDVTADNQQSEGRVIRITPMGRSDVSAQTQPAALSLQVDNRSGAYSDGAQGINYPNVKEGVPIRVSLNLTGNPLDTSIRFQGNIWSFKPTWDTTGRYAVVDIAAAGVMRRDQQGTTPLKSAIRRFFTLTNPKPVVYWPLEDPDGSLSAASGLSGGTPMAAASGAGPGVAFGQGGGRTQPDYTGFSISDVGSLPRVSLGNGGSLTASIPTGTGSPVSWTIQFIGRTWAYTGVAGADIILAEWPTPGGTFARFRVISRSLDGGVSVLGVSAAGALTTIMTSTLGVPDEVLFRTAAYQDGANVVMGLRWSRVTHAGEVGEQLTDTRAGTLAWPTAITFNPANAVVTNTTLLAANLSPDLVIGHCGVWLNTFVTSAPFVTVPTTDPLTGKPVCAWNGFEGESATNRLIRICAEQGIPIDIAGTSLQAMGVQGADTFLNLLRECETADLGTLGEGRGPGYYYVSNSARYNQLVTMNLNIAADQIVPEFDVELDDLNTRNSVTTNRRAGSQAIFADSTGPLGTTAIGVYDSTAGGDLNLFDDSTLSNISAFQVGLGTVRGYRYPTIALDLRKIPTLAANWLTMRAGSRMQLTNVSSYISQHPNETIDLLAEGWGERFSRFIWSADINCSRADPYSVGVVQGTGTVTDPPLRLESDCVLALDITPTDTTMFVTSASGNLFAEQALFPADYPVDLEIEGERMSTTFVGGAFAPQQVNVTRSVNGIVRAHGAGVRVKLWRPAGLAL